MYSDRQTSQSGSVAIFLIVTAVFVALVVGGMYAVQNRSKQSQATTPAPTAQNPASTSSPQPSDQQKQADEAKKKQQEQQAAEEQRKAQDKAQAEKQAWEAKKKQDELARQNAAKAQTPAAVPQTSTAPAPPAATAPSSNNLPTTGPEENLIQLIAGGIMVAMLGAYLKSYRHRFGSLLR